MLRTTKIWSPILDKLGMTGVFIDSTNLWETIGIKEWKCMIDNFNELPYYQKVIGLDTEWYYNSPTCVIQIASLTHCFVFHLTYIKGDEVLCALKKFLEQEDIVACGVGVGSDAGKMLKDTGIQLKNTMDIDIYAELYFHVGVGHHSLKALGYDLAGFDMPIKTKNMAMSNWSRQLDHLQRRYAAEDAAISFAVGKKIVDHVVEMEGMQFGNSLFSSENHSPEQRISPLIQWIQSTSTFAKKSFSRVCSEQSKIRNAKPNREGDDLQGNGDNPTGKLNLKHSKALSSSSTSPTTYPITILDEDLTFLFECDHFQGVYFSDHHSLSEVLNFYPETSRPKTIKLKFDGKRKSRLCIFHIFLLPCAKQCSFAHGVEDLDPESQKLLEEDVVKTCSICAGVGNLVQQSIVPPVYRRCLPSTLRHPLKAGGVLICPQCQPMITFYIQEEIKRIENAAASLNPLLRRDRQKCVGRSVSLARLLLNDEKRKALPKEKIEEYLNVVFKTWEEFGLESFSSDCTSSINEKEEENEIEEKKEVDKEWMLVASRLKKIAHFCVGKYQIQAQMNTLVGDDLERGKLFVDRWWEFMVKECHILDKERLRICNKGKKADEQWTKCSTITLDEVKEENNELHNSSVSKNVQESE